MIEHFYKSFNPFLWSLVFSFVSLTFFYFRYRRVGLYFTFIVLMLETLGIAARSYIGSRAPVTNMYETVLACGYFALIIMLIFFWKKREWPFVLMGLILNLLTLSLINFVTSMFDPSIGHLMPVLRSNFWLSIHVTTIVLAYSGLALSWIFSNTYLIRKILIYKIDANHYSEWIYSTVKIGVIFLVIGIVTGAIWADYSWGRFWGWDPKETWALIVLLLYMAILHGKYTAWISKTRFIPLVALAFLFVMMAWFGVNYLLATGLHSYGFSQGGALFLGLFFIAQIVVVGIYQLQISRIR